MLGSVLAAPGASAEVDPAAYITIRAGGVPIIISAPHGGDRLFPGIASREDRGQRFFAIVRDQRTAELAEALAAHIAKRLGQPPFLVIARFDRRHIDANRAAEDAYAPPGEGGPKRVYDAYHNALADASARVTARWGHGLLIDLHGQSRFPDKVIRGTDNGETVESLLKRYGADAVIGPRSIFGALAAKGYGIAPSGVGDDTVERYFAGGYIVRTWGSAGGGPIDAIQMEVGSRFRSQRLLQTTARDLAAAIATFAKAYLPAR